MTGPVRTTYQKPQYRFEINPNARRSSLDPLTLCEMPSIDHKPSKANPIATTAICDPILFQSSNLREFDVFLTGLTSSIPDLFLPEYKIDYPPPNKMNYFSVEGRYPLIEKYPIDSKELFAWFVVKLPEPTTISRISFMGNLLIPPYYDKRGAVTNFGLPKTLTIYATDYWPDIVTPMSLTGGVSTTDLLKISRDWKKVFHSNDFRGLWGWTPITFHPIHCRYLIFMMSDLPTLDPNPSNGEIVKGLSIKRIGIHSYVEQVNSSKEVQYTPVVSWQNDYEDPIPEPFYSDLRFWYWQSRGAALPPIQEFHQSIFSSKLAIPGSTHRDHLPSALVGFPEQVRMSDGSYDTVETYSGDLVLGDRTISTNLVVQVTEDELPFVEGFLIEEPGWPRGFRNTSTFSDSVIDIYHTDDPQVAFSPNQDSDEWIHIGTYDFDYAAEDFAGKQIIFDREINAKFYRFKHRFNDRFEQERRFELSKLTLLRSKHMTLVASKDEVLSLDHVRVRVFGPNLVENYSKINGNQIMDLVCEVSTENNPFQPYLSLRTALDIRERTQSQIIANTRITRPYYQEFHDKVTQGIDMPSYPDDLGLSTDATTISNQEIFADTPSRPSRQRVLSASKQTHLIKIDPARPEIFDKIDDVIKMDSGIVDLINGTTETLMADRGLDGVTTDRDVNLQRNQKYYSNIFMEVLKQLTGVPVSQINEICNLARTAGWSSAELKHIFPGFKWWKGALSGGKSIPYIPPIGLGIPKSPKDLLDVDIYEGANLKELPQRPGISISASLGGQFFAGGSMGVSSTLDGGKSTSQSTGTQGIANETITKHLGGNTPSAAEILSSIMARHSYHTEFYEKIKQFVTKGEEIKFEEKSTDIILMTIPAQSILNPAKDDKDTPDCYRIRVGYLPDDVELDVTFVGTAIPQPKSLHH